jgi:hypothetical protein
MSAYVCVCKCAYAYGCVLSAREGRSEGGLSHRIERVRARANKRRLAVVEVWCGM